MTLRSVREEYGVTDSAMDALEDVLYALPEPPSMTRFKRRISALTTKNDEYERYRMRVYVRLMRMQKGVDR